MIALLIASLISFFLLLTFGFASTKLCRIPAAGIEKLWLGLIVVNALTTLISLVLPINTPVLLAFLSIGTLLIPWIYQDLKADFSSYIKDKKHLSVLLPFIIISFFLALNPPYNYDTAFYHLPSIKWIEAYRAVPGVANLHGRFGFNSNSFTFFALTSVYDLFEQEIFALHLVILLMMLSFFTKRLLSTLKAQGYSKVFFFYVLILLRILFLHNVSSPSPDFLLMMISTFVFVRTYELLENAETHFQNYLIILLLSVYLLSVKLAALPLAVIGFFVLWRYRHQLFPHFWKLLIGSLWIMVPWLIRNVILSGWLIYPFEGIDLFEVDWKVPLEDLRFEKMIIEGAGREIGMQCLNMYHKDFMDWFAIWWDNNFVARRMIFVLSFPMPAIALVQLVREKKLKSSVGPALLCVTALLSLAFWFYIAPAWRFGEPFLLLAVTAPILVLCSDSDKTPKWKRIATILYYLGLLYYNIDFLMLGILLVLPMFWVERTQDFQERVFNLAWCTLVLGYLIYFLSSPLFIIKKVKTDHLVYTPAKMIRDPEDLHFNTQIIDGFEIYEPAESDRCYEHPIPCTGYADENATLRFYTKNDEGIPDKACLTERIQARGTRIVDGFRRLP